MVLVVGAFLNQHFNLDNPNLERKLVGCWGIAGSGTLGPAAEVLDVAEDGTFVESAIHQFAKQPGLTSASSNSGKWAVQKSEWTLFYQVSNGGGLSAKHGRLVLTVIDADADVIHAQDKFKRTVTYQRLPLRNGACRRTA